MRTALNWLSDILLNPITWVVVAALVAAIGGTVTLYRQREQARDIKGWLMGGDSWAYFVPWPTSDGKMAFFIRHVGDYPAYDVNLRIKDELRGGKAGNAILIAPALWHNRGFDWTEPKELTFSGKPSPGESHRYLLEISMRSGTVVIQRIQLWEVKGLWHSSSKDIVKNGVSVAPPKFPEAQDAEFPPIPAK